jgi:2-oxo-3-(phosphooxy)propyl 3-oxoalkanoate synthase
MSTVLQDALIDTFQLSFEQTVPRSLVHKRSLENVLLTEVRSRAEDHFMCGGRIPTAHRFFNDGRRTPRKDVLFYTELGRQASLAISHSFLGISKDDVFIFEQSQAWIEAAALKSALQPSSDSVITEIRVREIKRRRNYAVSRVVAEQVMSIDGEQVFKGTGAWTVQPAALFERLRAMSKPRAAERVEIPQNFRKTLGGNTVIFVPKSNEDRTEFVTSLVIDQTHSYFFDHPCDHVPGMLLLEGCTQLAQAAVARSTRVPPRQLTVTAYDVNFRQFVECDRPVTLTAQLDRPGVGQGQDAVDVRVSISQQDVQCGTATVSVAFQN